MSHETPAMVKEVSNELHQQSEAETSLSLWNSATTTLIHQKSILVKNIYCIYNEMLTLYPCLSSVVACLSLFDEIHTFSINLNQIQPPAVSLRFNWHMLIFTELPS